MSFDDAFAQSDDAAFYEMATPITVGGIEIQAIISPKSSFQTSSDGFGGFQRVEGNRIDILTSNFTTILAGTLSTGQLVVIPGDYNNYRVVQILQNGATTSLVLGSTAGTGAQF